MIDPRSPDFQNTPTSSRRPAFDYRLEDPNSPPVVSIITPFYNTGAIFEETARSVWRQSLQQWEWIIVNDGSSDPESLHILDSYRAMDPRMRVIDHATNMGLPAARNTGARAARTEFLLYLDSDDLLEPTAAEKWWWFLVSFPQYSFVGGYSVGFGAHEYLWWSGFQNQAENLDSNRINHIIMIRKQVVEALGGYDERMRHGLEDWDFWVRAAAQGFWGDSVPEFLHWYRTRPSHTDRWDSLADNRQREMRAGFRRRYPHLWKGGFPAISRAVHLDLIHMEGQAPDKNRLQKTKPRLLIVAPWLVTGGAEKFNLDLMRQFSGRGWELTIATTKGSENPWQHEYEAVTPDVFPLPNFLEARDYPRFIAYLVQSRQVDALILASSEEAYRLLPYLRLRFPRLPILDFLHFITPDWMDGGIPRLSLLFQSCLDLTVVSSCQLKRWMAGQGADEERLEVCTTNADVHTWHPDPATRVEVRSGLGLADEQALILFIGRLEKQKQPRVFAQTMLLLAREKLPFLALVLGDGSLRAMLQGLVDKERLGENVRLLGDTPQRRVRELIAAADILFLPSENEGIALTIFESMASGVVPVGAAVGGQPELVTPECGILIRRSTEDQEAAEYAQALAGLIRDPDRRRQMGRNSRERVAASFNLEQMGERMEALVRRAGQLRLDAPREPAREDLAHLVGRQAAEFFRAAGELKKYEPYQQGTMPPASAGTYAYFAVRQLFYPLLHRFSRQSWFVRVKSGVKSVLIRGKAPT